MSRLATCPLTLLFLLGPAAAVRAAPREEVERAIREGVRYLKAAQREDGSWADVDAEAPTGTTSLAVLALIAAGEPVDSPAVDRAVRWLRKAEVDAPANPDAPRPSRPGQAKAALRKEGQAVGAGGPALRSVYAVSLQTRVFAAVSPVQDRERIARNANWLESAQIRPRERVNWAGSWTYAAQKVRPGDGSNSFYALLGLDAAAEAGVPVRPATWTLAGRYWGQSQRRDLGWGYTPDSQGPTTSSMTCEGVASLILARTRGEFGGERPEGDAVRDCGKPAANRTIARGTDWLAAHFHVDQNFGNGRQWKYYHLDALEQVGSLTGRRLLGGHDWYLEGVEELVRTQDTLEGGWSGALFESNATVATSFALLFLGRGRAPVLIQKARHGPGDDWMNDPDDVRNLVKTVARDWKRPLSWQVVDPDSDAKDVLAGAPVLFLNGHLAPELTGAGKRALRGYVERGGFVFAEACCGRAEFDEGFRALVREVVPDPGQELHKLPDDHPVWRGPHALKPGDHPLWGVDRGGRTVLIYSPGDLSCGWNQRDRSPEGPATSRALRLGQNVVDYATGRKPPPDKLDSTQARPAPNARGGP